MKHAIQSAIRLLVVMALLLTSVVAFAQDEADTTTTIPFIGIRFFEADDGVLVTGIITNTPAATINLQAGDVVEAIEGQSVNSLNVQEIVWDYDVNDTVTMTVNRDGELFEQDITLMERPVDLFNNPLYVIPLDLSSIGLMTMEVQNELMVVGTVDGSQAQEAGFQLNDVITRVDGDRVEDPGEAAVAMSDLTYGDEAVFYVNRGNRRLIIRIIIIDRRHQPRDLAINSTFETIGVKLGYGNNFVQVQALDNNHELYEAGLRANDVITAANGEAIDSAAQLFANDSIDLTVERGNSILYFNVPNTVAPLLMFGMDTPQTQEAGEWLGLHEKQVTLGVRYIQLEANSPYFQGADIQNGAYVAEVIAGLPAAQSGIQVGDIIVAVEGADTTMEVDLRNRIYAHQPGDKVTLDILRNGELIQVEVVLRVATS